MKFYGSFPTKYARGKFYQPIEAPDMGTARQLMVEEWGERYAFVYAEEHYERAVKQYDLQPLPFTLRP